MIRSIVKTSLGAAAPYVPGLQEELERSLTVFLYHDVSDAPALFSRECGLVVSVECFERQLEFLAETFCVISVDELLAGEVPPRAALITFDDGVAGVFRHALPLLRKAGLPSTLFLNMAPVAGEPFWPPRMLYYFSIHLRIHPRPAFVIDITPHIDAKIAFIRCYESQFITGRARAFPTALDDIRDRARYWGWSIGTSFGEPFASREEIGLKGLDGLC